MRWCITLAIILLAQAGFADIDLERTEFFEKSVRPVDHWAFRARTRPSPPTVKDPSWPHNPVDNFILAKLERNQLAPSPPADKRTLLRRSCFDLVLSFWSFLHSAWSSLEGAEDSSSSQRSTDCI